MRVWSNALNHLEILRTLELGVLVRAGRRQNERLSDAVSGPALGGDEAEPFVPYVK